MDFCREMDADLHQQITTYCEQIYENFFKEKLNRSEWKKKSSDNTNTMDEYSDQVNNKSIILIIQISTNRSQFLQLKYRLFNSAKYYAEI